MANTLPMRRVEVPEKSKHNTNYIEKFRSQPTIHCINDYAGACDYQPESNYWWLRKEPKDYRNCVWLTVVERNGGAATQTIIDGGRASST